MVIRGVIRPPPDIRAVVDKTALFVSKNGRAFESRILNSDKGKTTKFAFLHGTSPFHAYYEERIRFYESGGKDGDDAAADTGGGGGETEAKKESGDGDDSKASAASAKDEGKARAEGGDEGTDADEETAAAKTGADVGPTAAAAGSKSRTRKASVDPISRALLAERADLRRATAPPPPKDDGAKDGEGERGGEDEAAQAPAPVPLSSLAPPSLPFATMAAPSNATPAQLDVMRLTAQFACLTRVASGGKSSGATTTFLDELTLREWNNPTFAFLQPRHGHFAYFTALVDGYRRILYLATTTGKEEVGGGELETTVAGMMKKTELEDLRKSREERESCRRRNGAGSAAIDAGRGEGAGLGGCLRAAARRAEYDRLRSEEEERKKAEAEGGGATGDALGGVAAVDWHDFVVVETIDFAVDEEVQAPPPPPPPPPRKPSALPEAKEEGRTDLKPAEAQEEEEDEDMDMDTEDEDEEEKIEIVSDYAPKIVSHASAAEDLTRTHMIDPITGKSVALADMSEHMRIQLLDPKWAEEKKRFMEKQKESNFVRGTDIAKNISRFAKQRGDIFGSSEAELLHQEEDSRKRLEEANRIIREQASLPQPQHQPQPESTVVATAAGSKRPSEPGYPSAPTGVPEVNTAPPAKKPRPMTSAQPSMPPPPPPVATFPPAAAPPPPPPPPATRSPPPPPPPAVSNAPPESSDAIFAQESHLHPPPPPPSSVQQPAKVSPPKPTPAASAAVDAPGPPAAPAAPPAEKPDEEEPPAPPPAPFIPGVVQLSIKIPLAGPDDHQWTQWQFRGQTVSIEVDDAKTATIKSVKERLRPTLGNMPLNKMQLKGEGGFLRDGVKLADAVRGPTERMELVPKVRGGRK